jgi:hypothetical protein
MWGRFILPFPGVFAALDPRLISVILSGFSVCRKTGYLGRYKKSFFRGEKSAFFEKVRKRLIILGGNGVAL